MLTSTDDANIANSLKNYSEKEKITVICAADDNYAMPLAVTVRSAIENLNENYNIALYIIDGGIKNGSKHKILKTLSSNRCTVAFIPKPDAFIKSIEESYNYLVDSGQEKKYLAIATYFRLAIPELLPDSISKAIYLDSDLVVRGNLGELWAVDLGNNYLMAVQDTYIQTVSNSEGLQNYQQLKIPERNKYFNAGVLVLNLNELRSDRTIAKSIEHLKNNKQYIRYGDQDILNGLLFDRWGELDPKWNFQTSIYDYSSWQESPFTEEVYQNLISHPAIVHYVSATKPWTGRNVLLAEDFYRYLDLTAWSGWRLTIFRRIWRKLNRDLNKFLKLTSLKS